MRSAIQPEAILYMTLRRLIGRHFFKNCLSFPYFGMQVIIANLFGSENCINSLELLIALAIKELISVQKNLKNSHVNPSGPGVLSFFFFFLKTKNFRLG